MSVRAAYGPLMQASPTSIVTRIAYGSLAIGVLVLVGLVTQSAGIVLALAALLVWNVVAPKWNPFDALYDALIARPRGLPRLGPAPAPRRFAQGMSAAFMLGIGVSLSAGGSVWPRDNLEMSVLFAEADAALVDAKRGGRGRAIVDGVGEPLVFVAPGEDESVS